MAEARRLTVALIFGGQSSEHSISCATAGGVLGAIDREKYDVVAVGITRAGQWVLASDDPADWQLAPGRLPEVVADGSSASFALGASELGASALGGDGGPAILEVTQPGVPGVTRLAIDVVFAVLHGPLGEDGTLQGYLELLGVPYVGNGVFASAAAMDKEFAKALFTAAGVPCTPHLVFHKHNYQRDAPAVATAIRQWAELPVFVKPARAGSSVGVSKVSQWQDLAAALELAFEQDTKLVVERAVVGREIECAVLGSADGGPPRVSVAGEIVVRGREFYDFDAKYQDEAAVDLLVPAPISDRLLERLQQAARQAFAALGCAGIARVDFFVVNADAGEDEQILVNEINTMPGFTPLSMYPMLWRASGLSYAGLIDELLALALTAAPGARGH